MKFYSEGEIRRTYPCLVLYKDNWDDYGFKITFDIRYHKNPNEEYNIGAIKILDVNSATTVLPDSFSKLENTFFSLGTSLEFYENLKLKFELDEVITILKSLNDIAFDHSKNDLIKDHIGYNDALLRFTSSELLLKTILSYILENRVIIDELSSFTYKFKLPEANDYHKVNFDYAKQEILFSTMTFPYRINAIIGKNGTGKTQFIASMVKALAGIENEEGFDPSIPQFSKIIAISYSIFDDFPKPKENSKFSYSYIGYRESDEVILTSEKLNDKLIAALSKIIEKQRTEIFFDILSEIIDLKVIELNNYKQVTIEWVKNFDFSSTKKLSSGQSILFFIITELIAEIQKQSFILFDEPETHLHPAATSILIESLYKVLEEYDSYALLTTHSPLFLQNIPSRYIHIFDRIGNTPNIKRLSIETFGANISEISDQVFDTVNVVEFYKKTFDQFNSWTTEEDIKELFKNELSFNAKLYLNSKK